MTPYAGIEERLMRGASYKLKRVLFLPLCGLIILLSACGGPTGKTRSAETFQPVFYPNEYAPTELCEGVEADLTTADSGYIGLSSHRDKRVKAGLSLDGEDYIYTLAEDGSVTFLPLQLGSGVYSLAVYENTTGDRYIELYRQEVEAAVTNEFLPFLHSNQYVPFESDDESVRLAGELAAKARSEAEFVKSVYEFISDSVSYDNELAATVEPGYLPQPDRTLELGKGICVDYSSLAAAMLRSQGIPAKIIMGYVGKDALYHAWNAVYLKETGWITVGMRISADDWSRMDITLATSGDIEKTYIDRSVY